MSLSNRILFQSLFLLSINFGLGFLSRESHAVLNALHMSGREVVKEFFDLEIPMKYNAPQIRKDFKLLSNYVYNSHSIWSCL